VGGGGGGSKGEITQNEEGSYDALGCTSNKAGEREKRKKPNPSAARGRTTHAVRKTLIGYG